MTFCSETPRRVTASVVAGLAILLLLDSKARVLGQPGSGTKPKYGPLTVPLSRDNAYFRHAAAPDFWALSPYYLPQEDDRSCSLATLSMLVNAARRNTPLSTDEPLVTQPALLARVHDPTWTRGLAPGGAGVTLDQLAALASKSLESYRLQPRAVQVTHVDTASPEALASLRRALLHNEASGDDQLLFNFVEGAFTGDGDAGHIAPVGAYDAEQHRVLILDPDRTWYEPYWIPDEVALRGMATLDRDAGAKRGYVYVCYGPAC